jgi:hypothetical protein
MPPTVPVLLPADFPVEAKALKQLANLATIRHPAGGEVRCLCATPVLDLMYDNNERLKKLLQSFPSKVRHFHLPKPLPLEDFQGASSSHS